VIENKVHEPHTLAQTRRELIDTARDGEPIDVTLVTIALERVFPHDLRAWERDIRATAADYDVTDVELDLAYSSWAQIAGHIDLAASTHPNGPPTPPTSSNNSPAMASTATEELPCSATWSR